jgi:hypothetical protein
MKNGCAGFVPREKVLSIATGATAGVPEFGHGFAGQRSARYTNLIFQVNKNRKSIFFNNMWIIAKVSCIVCAFMSFRPLCPGFYIPI